jgi:DNA-binding response OmpR family regulator
VLLAEDDDDMRRHLASALRAEGFQVRPVRSGVELLKSFGALLLRGRLATSVDLVISDLRMPGITGLKVLDWLRRANWRVPFILITSFGDESVHAEARRLGATSLDKPFDVRELIAQARSVAARGQ